MGLRKIVKFALLGLALKLLMIGLPFSGGDARALPPPPSVTWKEVRRYSSPQVKLNYELNVKQPDQETIDKILSVAENIPDAMQRAINDGGGRLVIYDGLLSENEGLEYLSGLKPPILEADKTYDDFAGLYASRLRKAFVDKNKWECCYNTQNGTIELHELGHALDHLYGNLYNSEEFLRIYADFTALMLDAMKWPYEFRTRREFFAENFARFYISDQSRERLKKQRPEVYNYFENLERRIIDGSQIPVCCNLP